MPGESPPAREWIGGRLPASSSSTTAPSPTAPDIVIWMKLRRPPSRGPRRSFVHDDNHGPVARILRSALVNPLWVSPDSPTPFASLTTTAPTKCAPKSPEPSSRTDASPPNSSKPCSPPATPSLTTTRSCAPTSPHSASTQPAYRSLDSSARAGACWSFSHARNFEQFLETAAKRPPQRATPNSPAPAFGAEVISLTFHNATQLPATMRREAMQHHWPVNSPDADPVVARRDPNGIPRPFDRRDRRDRRRRPSRSPKARRDLQGRHLRTQSASRTSTTRTARSASPSPIRGGRPFRTSTSPRISTAVPDIGSGGSARRHRLNGGRAPGQRREGSWDSRRGRVARVRPLDQNSVVA